MNKDDVAGLIREARLDAKAFRENTVYDGEGDAIRLIANAERLDQYADALTILSAENERLREALEWICKTCREEIPMPYEGKMREILLRSLAEVGEEALAGDTNHG